MLNKLSVSQKIYFILTIFILLNITFLSLKPQTTVEGSLDTSWIRHILAYAVLTFCLFKTIKNKNISLIFAGAYGFVMEFLQGFVPTRVPSISDGLINILGSFIILIFLQLTNKNVN